jgi:hypothetical protein
MHESYKIKIDASESSGSELMAACEHIVRELVEGVQHGKFGR